MAEVTIPVEPDWWRARDRDGVLWFREPHDDGNDWCVSGGGLLAFGWQWAEAYEQWGPFTCADGEVVDGA